MPIASLESLMGRRAILPFLEAGAVDVCIIDPLWNGVAESVRGPDVTAVTRAVARLAALHTCAPAAYNARPSPGADQDGGTL